MKFQSRLVKKECIVPVFSRASDVDILDVLGSFFSLFNSFYESDAYTVEHMWCFFKNLVLTCVKKFIPHKRHLQRTHNPWMRKEIARHQRKVNKAKRQYRRYPCSSGSDKISE